MGMVSSDLAWPDHSHVERNWKSKRGIPQIKQKRRPDRGTAFDGLIDRDRQKRMLVV
jgi:type III secretory pathway component EscU